MNNDSDLAGLVASLSEAQRACFDLVANDHPVCIPAEDARLESFCDDVEPIDTFNSVCNLGLIVQLGCGDFDDFREVLTPLGLQLRDHLKGKHDGG